MQRPIAQRLHDAAAACRDARTFCAPVTRDQFLRDRVLHLAVQKLIEIVGEALRQAESLDRTSVSAIPELRVVVNTRNRLVHGYDSVDYGALWDIVQRHIPELERQPWRLLEDAPPLHPARDIDSE